MILSFSFTLCNAQSPDRAPAPRKGIGLLKKSPAKNGKAKIRAPRSMTKVKRKQESDEKKRDRDLKKFVKENRAHALEIQTTPVRERMIQNRKQASANYKAKKKAISSNGKKAARKYR